MSQNTRVLLFGTRGLIIIINKNQNKKHYEL